MMDAVVSVAYPLYKRRIISLEEFGWLCSVYSVQQMVDVAGALYKAGRITPSIHDRLVHGAERGEEAAAEARKKAKLREIDRYVNGRTACPHVQGGLPSLGKRRP